MELVIAGLLNKQLPSGKLLVSEDTDRNRKELFSYVTVPQDS